ncbi:MAG: DUF2306 domain-containing protein [Pyrinomonadaceae bacterium]|nr:DUF2306 domain-containing protein [Pyrinomonadaceae bacterium]
MKKEKSIIIRLLWTGIILLSAYYLYRAVRYRFFVEGIGETFWNKQFWFVFHLITALPVLILGPIQFSESFRQRHINRHRQFGKIYVVASIFGGLSALYLGFTLPYQGSIVPVIIGSLLWLFMTTGAWVTIKRKNVQAHRLFMIRSYVLALTFISLRILSDMVEHLNILFFIENQDVKDTTYEWMSWVLPLLVTELWINWVPLLKQKKKIA